MKYILALLLMATAFPAYAANASFVASGGGDKSIYGLLANEDGLTYNRLYYLPATVYSAKKISITVAYSSATYANVSFSTNAYTNGSGNIAITAHGLTMGVPVIARLTAGTMPSPLVAETTYYAYPVTANIVALSSTAVKAQASDPIIWGSSKPAIGAQTYTLVIASPSISGTPSFKFQGANNDSAAFDLDIQAVSITEYTAGGAIVGFDFDDFNYTTLILNVTAPTAGGLNIKAKANLKLD